MTARSSYRESLVAGEPLQLPGGKQRSLLAPLLLHANEVVSIDRLIEELWGESPPASDPKIIQAHVSRLRKALEGASGSGEGMLPTCSPAPPSGPSRVSSTSTASKSCSKRAASPSRLAKPSGRPYDASRGPHELAWPAVLRLRLRAVCPDRDRPSEGTSPRLPRGADRG